MDGNSRHQEDSEVRRRNLKEGNLVVIRVDGWHNGSLYVIAEVARTRENKWGLNMIQITLPSAPGIYLGRRRTSFTGGPWLGERTTYCRVLLDGQIVMTERKNLRTTGPVQPSSR